MTKRIQTDKAEHTVLSRTRKDSFWHRNEKRPRITKFVNRRRISLCRRASSTVATSGSTMCRRSTARVDGRTGREDCDENPYPKETGERQHVEEGENVDGLTWQYFWSTWSATSRSECAISLQVILVCRAGVECSIADRRSQSAMRSGR